MVWQEDAAENWLGLNVVSIFGPEGYMGGQYTPAKVVDDINANPEKYQNVKYVIENMQSGEMAKGIEEALHDRGIMADRVIFTNFPESMEGVDSLPDVLTHNKDVVMASPVTSSGGDSGSDNEETALATDLNAGEESEFCFDDCAVTRVVIVPEEEMSSLTMSSQELSSAPAGASETASLGQVSEILKIAMSPWSSPWTRHGSKSRGSTRQTSPSSATTTAHGRPSGQNISALTMESHTTGRTAQASHTSRSPSCRVEVRRSPPRRPHPSRQ
jgi:hypothetical protein